MRWRLKWLHWLVVFLSMPGFGARAAAVSIRDANISSVSYESIQQALDSNPGKPILIPPGDYNIGAPLRITSNNTVLHGFGRIVQTNAAAAIVEIHGASNVTLRDLVFARSEEAADSLRPGIEANGCHWLRLDGIQVIDSHSPPGAIQLNDCRYARIENCTIRNYKQITIDDRTMTPIYGYAFRCLDGHGIMVRRSVGTAILNNRIVEERLLPTREVKEKYHLGELTEGKQATKAGPLGTNVVTRRYAQHWHQGSAIQVSSPESTDFTQVIGNYLENSAQGIDLHGDHLICSRNIVNRGMMGIKVMHGSRHAIVSDNLLSHVDLWGIFIGSGSLSHGPQETRNGQPAREDNSDGGIMIANNVISDYGYGNEYWNWGGASSDQGSSIPIRIDKGQLPGNPGVRDVLIEGNMVTDRGREGVIAEGKVTFPRPRYRYAVHIEKPASQADPFFPSNIVVRGNLFHPGTAGVANFPIDP